MTMRLAKYFEELIHFRAAVEHGSLNGAAARLGISQPGLTRSIKRLELHVGVRLLDRTGRGVLPTPYGEALFNHVRLIDSELERAASTLERLRHGTEGVVRCGGTIGALARLVPSAIDELQAFRPGIRVIVFEAIPPVLRAMLRVGELDAVVCARADGVPEPDLVTHSIGADQIDIFARSGHLCQSGRNSLSEIAKTQRWILPAASGDLRHTIEQDFARHKVELPTKILETSSLAMVTALLARTDHLAVTTSHTLWNQLQAGTVKRLKGDWVFSQTATVVHRRADTTPSHATTSFIKCLQRAARNQGAR